MPKLMKCGHIGIGEMNGKPVCPICAGTSKLAEEVMREVEGKDGLNNRQARCWSCGKVVESDWGLAFFSYRPNANYDGYYCGCDGWN